MTISVLGWVGKSKEHCARKRPDVYYRSSNSSKTEIPDEGTRIMIFGMTTFTFVHVALSLIGIFSGFVVLFGMLAAKRLDGWTALFLASTVLGRDRVFLSLSKVPTVTRSRYCFTDR